MLDEQPSLEILLLRRQERKGPLRPRRGFVRVSRRSDEVHVRLEARVPELRRRPPREDGAEVARDLERVLEAEPVAVLFRSVGGEGRGGAAPACFPGGGLKAGPPQDPPRPSIIPTFPSARGMGRARCAREAGSVAF